jgi:hypothetical protein
LFPDGIIHLSIYHQPLDDLLHSLFDAFYESDRPFKPTSVRVKHNIQNKQALILLDDIGLTRNEVQTLMHTASACTFVLASSDRFLWGEGRTLTLKGLTPDAAYQLMERELGWSRSKDRSEVEALVVADGSPLSLLQAIPLVREGPF